MNFSTLKIFRFILQLLFVALPSFFLSQQTLSKYVDPFIGTGGHGHTFPGAVMPFGMVQLSPDTRVDGSWDGCGGYHYSDSVIYGFSHTHLSGTGVSDWGDVLLMPMSGKISFDNKIYASRFSHGNEKAKAGYYEVFLEDERVKAELTVTPRVGIHQYFFPDGGEMNVVLDLLHRDKLLKGKIKVLDSNTVVGYRISEAWAKDQHCYFAIRFSRAIQKTIYAKDKNVISKSENATAAAFGFRGNGKTPLLVKVAISSVNEEGALDNLNKEALHWNFEKYKTKADSVWNKQLEKIIIKDTGKTQLVTFYTALYHCFIHPSLNMDVNNKYRGRDNQIHTAQGFTNYSVFSLWDTYRALHPLFTIIERERTSDFINTFLKQHEQGGRLPVWELSGNETDCMIGYHAVSVITDALAKGIPLKETMVYDAMKATATYSGYGIPEYIKKNYLGADDESESVSKTLEYAYDDWCVAQLAGRLNLVKDYNHFMKRSQSWKNLFDEQTGFMRPRKNGDWISPFDPKEVNNHYTEGNGWQYSFYVPHDIDGLIKLHGGDKNFEEKLDTLFSTGSKTSGRDQADITGLIGQYAHGNEPSHHMAYLYNYIGKPNKTQDKVKKIMNEFYTNSPDGLIGNEDCGQMSAWYVFSALGFYPVCPGSINYVTGTPLFDSVTVDLENGKKLSIYRNKMSVDAKYIASVSRNGYSTLRSSFTHNQLMNGGRIIYNLTASEHKFGQEVSNRPGNKTIAKPLIASPLICGSKSFEEKQEVIIKTALEKNCVIRYTLDGSEPVASSKQYKGPFEINTSCTVKARAYSKEDSSSAGTARFYKRPNNWDVQLISKYNPQYTAGGNNGIIDGIYGELNWRKGEWQGYQYTDFECVIDMKRQKEIEYVALDFLQDTRSWIIFPTGVDIYVSDDNEKFSLAERINNTVSPEDYKVQTRKFEKQLSEKTAARYVKLVARNFGRLPEWHEGRGDGAFIFIDEIEIR